MKGSVDAGSDHHLVVAEVKRKLLALKKEGSKKKNNYCIYKLKDQRVRHEFLTALANSYDALYNGSDNEEKITRELKQERSQFKEMHFSTCEEILGWSNKKKRSG